MTAAAKTLGPHPTQGQVARTVITVLAPIINETLAKLRALGYPRGDKAKLEAIYEGIAADTAKFQANPADVSNAKLYAPQANAFRVYGATPCGKFDSNREPRS